MAIKIFFRAKRTKNGFFDAYSPGKELAVFGAKDKKDCWQKCLAIARMGQLHRVDVIVDFPQEEPLQ